MTDLLLRDVRPLGADSVDVLIRDGRIAEISRGLQTTDVPVEEGRGAVLLPGLVEAHTHLDKNLLGLPWHPNSAGPTLQDRIDNERRLKRVLDMDPERQSARQVVLSIANGSTHIRSHVDVDTEHGLWGIEGVLATRERYRDWIDIELVAFPQSGLLKRPGTLELMAEALRLGAEVVGGIDPCTMDLDPKGHLDAVFGLAQRFGRCRRHPPARAKRARHVLAGPDRRPHAGTRHGGQGHGQPRLLPRHERLAGGGPDARRRSPRPASR